MKYTGLNTIATKLVTLTLFLITASLLLFSQAEPNQSKAKISLSQQASLQDLLMVAEQNNPGLKAASDRWQTALEQVPQARALPNPQLNYSYFLQQVETRVGPQYHKIGIMQMFPWFGKLALKGEVALEAANAEQQNYESLKINLFYRVKNAYFQYYYASRTVSILKENVQLLESLEPIIREKYRTGSAPFSSLIKIQVELDKMKEQLISAQEVLIPIRAKLNALLNRPSRETIPVPQKIADTYLQNQSLQLSATQLEESLKQNNPDLKSMDAMISKTNTGIRLAKKNSYPDFSLGMDYIITGEARMPGVSDSGKDPLMIMLSLQLPIWSKKNHASVKEAVARHQAAINQKQESQNNLFSQLQLALYNYHDALRKVTLYRDTLLPKAHQSLEVTRTAFETGKADFLDFIDSQRTLLSFSLTYEEAQTHCAQRLAEIQMIIGEEK